MPETFTYGKENLNHTLESFKAFFRNLKVRFLKSVDSADEKQALLLSNFHPRSTVPEIAAAEMFAFLNKKSSEQGFKVPQKKSEKRADRELSLAIWRDEIIEWLKYLPWDLLHYREDRRISEQNKQLAEKLHEKADADSNGQVWEERASGDAGIIQSRGCIYNLSNGRILKENILNLLSLEYNNDTADLSLKTNGKTIDFSKILPLGIKYGAVSMDFITERKPQNLKDYPGALGDPLFGQPMGYRHDLHRINYGNISNKGGMLSLLHEISHAYQHLYWPQSWQADLETFQMKVFALLSQFLKIKTQSDKFDSTQRELISIARRSLFDIRKQLRELEIDFEEDNFVSDRPLKDDEVRVKAPRYIEARSDFSGFIVKSNVLENLLRAFEKRERYAWAHALRVLKFLRLQGIDLEPEIKTKRDIQECVDQFLATYQKKFETIIELGGRSVRFVGNRKIFSEFLDRK